MAALDTSFLVDLARGRDAAQAALHFLLERREPIVVPAQAAIEYLSGVEDPVAGLADLDGSYRVLPIEKDHILEGARLGREAQKEGTFPGWADLQIGATALLGGHEVLTANPHNFEAINCEVWDYRNEARHPDNHD